MKVAGFIGADGEQGITVYKSIHLKVFKTINYMIDNDVYNIMFIVEIIDRLQIDTYIIHRHMRMFRIKKVNHIGKVFIYQIETTYGDDDSSDSIDFILPKKLNDVDKYKMRMFSNTEYENYISMMS